MQRIAQRRAACAPFDAQAGRMVGSGFLCGRSLGVRTNRHIAPEPRTDEINSIASGIKLEYSVLVPILRCPEEQFSIEGMESQLPLPDELMELDRVYRLSRRGQRTKRDCARQAKLAGCLDLPSIIKGVDRRAIISV